MLANLPMVPIWAKKITAFALLSNASSRSLKNLAFPGRKPMAPIGVDRA